MRRCLFVLTITIACASLGVLALAQAPPKAIVVIGLDAATISDLTAAAPSTVRLVPAATAAEVVANAPTASALIAPALTPDIVRAGSHLAWIQILNAGVEDSLPLVAKHPATLTSLKGILGPEVADHAMALLLALTRGLYQTIPARTWTVPSGIGDITELDGKTAVIIGVGGVGSQIATRAAGFGMTVVGIDPKDGPPPAGVTTMVKPDRQDEALKRADVVFVTVPDTPSTRGMIGAKQFAEMRQDAYFIAVSRGSIYSLAALADAIRSRHLAGAGLDVTDPEPLPSSNPIWQFPNVLITPHIAGASNAALPRIIALLKENIARFAAGQPLLGVVDKAKGY